MEKCDSGIYKITNIINGKFYIGSSTNINKRFICHRCTLRKNKHHNKPLQHSFNKYGIDNFSFEIIEYCNPNLLKEKEQILLDKYFNTNLLFNTFKDAYVLRKENHPMYGKHHSIEAIYKIKKARSKQIIKHSKETKIKISKSNKGKKVDKEHIKNMVLSRNGKAWNSGLKTGIEPINKIKFDKSQINNIINLYNSGYSIEAIRNIFNCDWSVIKNLLIKNNIKTRNISEQKNINLKRKL